MEKAEDLRTETERATRIQEQMNRMEKENTEMKGKVEMSKGYGGRGDMRRKGTVPPAQRHAAKQMWDKARALERLEETTQNIL